MLEDANASSSIPSAYAHRGKLVLAGLILDGEFVVSLQSTLRPVRICNNGCWYGGVGSAIVRTKQSI